MNYLKSNRQSNDDDFVGREKSQFFKANRTRETLSFEAQIFMKFLRNRSKKSFKTARSTRAETLEYQSRRINVLANILDEIKMTSRRLNQKKLRLFG